MKFPLVSRKRLNSANIKLAIAENCLASAGETLEKISGHNTTLKATLGTARAELVKANAEIKGLQAASGRDKSIMDLWRDDLRANETTIEGQQAEIDRLTAAFEKLTADYNDLGKKIPAFRPKAIRWSGPDGARAAIERAAYAESPAGKQEAAAKLSI